MSRCPPLIDTHELNIFDQLVVHNEIILKINKKYQIISDIL